MTINEKTANGLKLIAIKTLPGCDKKYLNILSPGELYYFYSNYKIDPETELISATSALPRSFYNVNNLKINISAIVGKNGSGKSTIIELLLRLINNMAIKQRIPQMEFERLEQLNLTLYFHSDTFHKIEVIGPDVFYYTYDSNGQSFKKHRKNGIIHDFFYSIVVNFSHYAYNTSDFNEGEWLRDLFHKNDGYQTPVVITPLREKGNIDINNENQLVLARLLTLFMAPSTGGTFDFRNVSNNLRATSVHLQLKPSKRTKELWRSGQKTKSKIFTLTELRLGKQKQKIFSKLNELLPFKFEHTDPVKDKLGLDYIIYKLVSICLKYADYHEYFEKSKFKFKGDSIDIFLEQLVADNSHITFKLRQMLNHLLFKELPLEDKKMTLDELDEYILRFRKRHKKETAEIIELLPPPIFSTKILLSSKSTPEIVVPFEKLSSGEKQYLYSVSSALYHLVNLNSVKKTGKRRKHQFVNVVLEEVELYFHPEMQRGYVKNLLDAVKTIKLDQIESVNFLLVTHSPFVLSDIPKSNILFLHDNGEPANAKLDFATYGANIHDLLKQSFFLEKGSMGAFAKSKIGDTINYLNFLRIQKELENLHPKLLDSSENSELHPLASELLDLKADIVCFDPLIHAEQIQIIDEPILKEKLSEMYDEYTGKNSRLNVIRNKIKLLKKQEKELIEKEGN